MKMKLSIDTFSLGGVLVDDNTEDELLSLITALDETIEDNDFSLKVVNTLLKIVSQNADLVVDTSGEYPVVKMV